MQTETSHSLCNIHINVHISLVDLGLLVVLVGALH